MDDAAAIKGPITFNRHIAPILFEHCAPCHRPGQAAPFSLLTFEEARKRAAQIAEVTASRYMPPWLPECAEDEFVGQRRLTAGQIALLARWAAEGAVEGDRADLPSPRQWTDGWHWGEPDLVVKLPEPYTLPAEGRDVYRNFVIPLPTTNRHYVRGFEFRPGNFGVVHHAFIRVDRTGESRRRDAEDAEPGFAGLHMPASAQAPDGQFLSWQPGKLPVRGGAGQTWTLEAGGDLVLQLHLQPSGKPEKVQPAVGFYFTSRPPAVTPTKIGLSAYTIDIPPGESNYSVRSSYTLPVAASVLAVLPHAHYLAAELKATARLPDGSEKRLLHIPRWDFNWQGDYHYRRPVRLPKGTVIAMDYRYDNSTNNVRNPHHPPQRVRYGVQSTDEMAELWLQLLTDGTNETAILNRDFQPRISEDAIAYNEYLLRLNPADAVAHIEIGKAQLFLGRELEATQHFLRAVELAPNNDEAHYFIGLMNRMRNQLEAAARAFETAIRLNPQNAKAHGNLGLVRLQQGDSRRGETHLRQALRLNPEDTVARQMIDSLDRAKGGRP
ncbi:MAG TPA: tetratricopeptide repeat protein [Methylomirabilota bacterium]|nr:tetratricopeptide repeat protein [Methylomirabilota bacterium]